MTIHPSLSVKIEEHNHEGKLIETSESKPKDIPKVEKSEATFNWFFSEYDKDPVNSGL